MSSKPPFAKIRRHTYSLAQLRVAAEAKAESHAVDIHGDDCDELPGSLRGLFRGSVLDIDQADADARRQLANGWVDWPAAMLPDGTRLVTFLDLAIQIAQNPRGYAIATGADHLAAGLENFRVSGCGDSVGSAVSFCIDGITYTAFEDPSYGRRASSMERMVAQEGNHCKNQFEPCALVPELHRSSSWLDDDPERADPPELRRLRPRHASGDNSDVLCLVDPGTGHAVISAGTGRDDDGDSWFVGHVDPEALDAARLRGIAQSFALADQMASEVAGSPAATKGARL